MMFTLDEGQLTIPEVWRDETVNVLTSGTGKEPAFSLVITRDDIPENMRFSDYAKQEVSNISGSLPKFKLIKEQSNYFIGDQPAHRIEFTWQSSEGVLHQIVAMASPSRQQRALVFTASAPDTMTEPNKLKTEKILQSFSFNS